MPGNRGLHAEAFGGTWVDTREKEVRIRGVVPMSGDNWARVLLRSGSI